MGYAHAHVIDESVGAFYDNFFEYTLNHINLHDTIDDGLSANHGARRNVAVVEVKLSDFVSGLL